MPTDLGLRPAEPADSAAVAELYLATREAAVPTVPPQVHSPEEVHAWVTGRIAGDEVEVWVATTGQALVGYATFTQTWLDDLYVDPGHQRTGIGSALLDLVKGHRPEGFSLWVFESNGPARAFYRGHGLVELEHTDGTGNEEGAPDLQLTWLGPDPLSALRRRIDDVDDDLALLLARRAALTAAVQDHKEVGGRAGRDPAREQEIVDRMVARAPGTDRARLTRIMHTVIEESLAAWEERA